MLGQHRSASSWSNPVPAPVSARYFIQIVVLAIGKAQIQQPAKCTIVLMGSRLKYVNDISSLEKF